VRPTRPRRSEVRARRRGEALTGESGFHGPIVGGGSPKLGTVIQARGLEVELDVPAAMRDGTVLRANVYRPSGSGPWPVLLARLPYGKDLPLGTSVLDPVQAARRGFMVVVQDTRGRFTSDGDWYPMVHEALDGVDTIAWAAALPGSNGRVGMYGASYFGFTQWSAAVHAPLALKAIAPFITWSDPRNGVFFRGGAVELGTSANWNLQMAMDVAVRRHRDDRPALGRALHAIANDLDTMATEGYRALPLEDFGPLARAGTIENFRRLVRADNDPEQLGHARIAGRYGEVTAAAYIAGGWFDIFSQDAIDAYRAMRGAGHTAKLLIGPWTHGTQRDPVGELTYGFGASLGFIDLRADFQTMQLRWFDHWLRDVDTGLLDEPPVKVFQMGANRWLELPDWPPPSRPLELHLRAGGALAEEAPGDAETPDAYDYDPADPVPTRGGALLMAPAFPAGPFDQRRTEARPDVLSYTGEPLPQDLPIAGRVTVQLWAASSAPDTDFVARLCDVHPDGRSLNLTDGIIRARHRCASAGEAPSPITPNRPYEYEIDLWSTCHVFKAGHRVRVQVTSSNFPRWDRNLNTGEPPAAATTMQVAHQTVFHERDRPSRIILPVLT
jgi:uncharacterized protein